MLANAFATSRVALCASGVLAAYANSAVWLPPFGTEGMASIAEQLVNASVYDNREKGRTITGMKGGEC